MRMKVCVEPNCGGVSLFLLNNVEFGEYSLWSKQNEYLPIGSEQPKVLNLSESF